MENLSSKKITLATVKSFIKKNKESLLINVKSRFDGMTDGVEQVEGGFVKAVETTNHSENTLGIAGAWFVGQSRDYFRFFENIGGDMIGIDVSNSCGRFVIAIKK